MITLTISFRSPLGNNSLLNFTRGSLIELSNGSLRRVEDLRTEDFILSAEKSQDLQLADSTVVKILSTNNNTYVMITFSYDNNRSKVRICGNWELRSFSNFLKNVFRLTLRRSWSTRSLYTDRDGHRATLTGQ